MKNRLLLSVFLLIISIFNGITQDLQELFSQNDSLESICNEIKEVKLLRQYLYSNRNDSNLTIKLYKRLLDNTYDNELYALTNHKSAMVKTYAYFGLNERNKLLLMAAIKKNINDTSKVNYSIGPYYNEICINKIHVNQLAIYLTYWGFYSNLSITLNDKDWKFIQKEYYKVIKAWGKDFLSYRNTIDGKAINAPQGATIRLKDGNYYFIKNKSHWEKEFKDKEIRITGNIELFKWKNNCFQRIIHPRYFYRKFPPGSDVIAPQGSWVEFYKQIEIDKIEIIEIK